MQLTVVFLVIAGIATTQEINCPDGKLTPRDRQLFVDQHNVFRSWLARGVIINKDGTAMPTARNMFKLNYSCELEKKSQELADKCELGKTRSKQGSNMHYVKYPANYPKNMKKDLRERLPLQAGENWWSEVLYYKNNPSNIFNKTVRTGHFVQMAWGKTYTIGCGIASECKIKGSTNLGMMLVCSYEKMSAVGEKIYEIGDPCTKDSDCSSRKCSPAEGLCIKTQHS